MPEDIFIFHAKAVFYWRLNPAVDERSSIFLIYSGEKVKLVNLSEEVSVVNEIFHITDSIDSLGEWINDVFDLWGFPDCCLPHKLSLHPFGNLCECL